MFFFTLFFVRNGIDFFDRIEVAILRLVGGFVESHVGPWPQLQQSMH